jgi:hypothetical protein
MATFYQAMTGMPRHIEERLLEFNILQLCALVCEKPGARWTGASDQYGPIKEIERRWKLDELTKRIADMHAEQPLLTYARIMTALGGNPARDKEMKRKEAEIGRFKATLPDGARRMTKAEARLPTDIVGGNLAPCKTIDDLKRVAAENGIPVDAAQWAKVAGMKNFGLSRMWLGNRWRWWLRTVEKTRD